MVRNTIRYTVYIEVTDFKMKKDWVKFSKMIADEFYADAKKIKLVMDNFKTKGCL